MTYQTPGQYLANRAKVQEDFVAKAKARKVAFEADPSKFNLGEAIDIVGLDKAMELYKSGVLTA